MLLPLLLGTWLGNFLDNLFKAEMENKTVMSDYKMSNAAFDFIGVYEAYRAKAYRVSGESFYTIGFGSTRIFSNDGLKSRAVLASDVVTLEQAKFHLRMYYNNPKSPKKAIDDIIKRYGFNLNQRFYDMLCQMSYASGSFHRNKTFNPVYIGMLQKANGSNDVEMLGDLLAGTWIAYLKNYANYNLYGLGWSRRAFAAAQYVKGKDYSKLTAERTIKKPY